MLVRYSRYFPQTRRLESQQDSASPGYALLERAGFVRPAGAAGIYTLLPLGWRVHRKVCDVIYDEMERRGVLNLQLPILQPKELWEQTGRWQPYVASKTMFRTCEEHRDTEFGLAPTAEEMVTALVAGDVRSWRELPLHLHQIGPKFRDEIRPRLGLLRCREFVMSDAYSFDRDQAGMEASFELYREIYTSIFTRLGLVDVLAVHADSGAIGGSGSAEFMVPSDVGEDTLLSCPECGYGANAEKASSLYAPTAPDAELHPSHRESTPDVTTVDQLQAQFPTMRAKQMVKTLIFSVAPGEPDEHLVAVCIRGDLTVNEVKLGNLVGRPIEPATPEQILAATGARVGFAGPIDLEGIATIYFDASVEPMTNFLCGANEDDVHVLDVNFDRDVARPEQFFELHLARGGDGCPQGGCDGVLRERRGIEVGHVFMLQRGYAQALGATYTTDTGEEMTIWMGCYGIGTTRVVQAIAEQHHDADGIVWPAATAPFDVHVVMTKPEDPEQIEALERVERLLDALGLRGIVDDRSASAGVKFKDADLIGCPYRVTVGRRAGEGVVEIRNRATKEIVETAIEGLAEAMPVDEIPLPTG